MLFLKITYCLLVLVVSTIQSRVVFTSVSKVVCILFGFALLR